MEVITVLTNAAVSAHRLTEKMAKRDSLADQLRPAASSAALNCVEGLQFTGANKVKFLKTAYGSAQEAKVATQILMATGQVDADLAQATWAQLDRGAKMVFGVLRRR